MVARPQTENAYSGSSITVLEGLEAVRKRPGMYIGSTGERGLHHLVWEVVDNAVDEALAGYCDTVDVTLLADGGVRVEDNGRGFPVDMHPVEKRPTVEVIMTVLHAGGKFDGKSYGVSGGLHGVGVTVVNALSTRLEVNVWRDGTEWRQRYDLRQAGPAGGGRPDRRSAARRSRSGPTPTIFETTDYSFDTINRRLQEMAFLNKGLTIVLRDERRGRARPRRAWPRRSRSPRPRRRPAPRRRRSSPPRSPTATTAASPTTSGTSTPQEPDPQVGGQLLRRRGRQERHGMSRRGRDAVVRGVLRVGATPSPTSSTPTRAAPTRRASGRR